MPTNGQHDEGICGDRLWRIHVIASKPLLCFENGRAGIWQLGPHQHVLQHMGWTSEGLPPTVMRKIIVAAAL